MATFSLIDQDLQTTALITPAFQMITLMSPLLYTSESGDNLIHKYEIGGVVWDSELHMHTSNASARAIVNEALIAQRLDAQGAPVAEFRPFESTEPVGVLNETELPTHVYRTRNSTFFNASASEELPLLAPPQFGRGGPVNVRVRKSLDDFTGLFLQFTLKAVDLAGGAQIDVAFSAWGQVYFRSRT